MKNRNAQNAVSFSSVFQYDSIKGYVFPVFEASFSAHLLTIYQEIIRNRITCYFPFHPSCSVRHMGKFPLSGKFLHKIFLKFLTVHIFFKKISEKFSGYQDFFRFHIRNRHKDRTSFPSCTAQNPNLSPTPPPKLRSLTVPAVCSLAYP